MHKDLHCNQRFSTAIGHSTTFDSQNVKLGHLFIPLCLLAVLLVGAQTAVAQLPPPAGSYRQTCQNYSWTGPPPATFHASCKNIAGQWIPASFPNPGQCFWGLTNSNGVLGCSLPDGSYAQTCQNIQVNGASVSASCKNNGGQWVQTSMADASPCKWGISNNNGVLMCGAFSGSYNQTCQNAYVSGNPLTLYASCKNDAGQWGLTSLANVDQCFSDVFNDNGVLRCGIDQLPGGSYYETCRNFYWSGNPPTLPPTLNATCKNNAGQWVTSSLTIPSGGCQWGIENNNGVLTCSLPDGSYWQTCQNIQVNGWLVTATCKNNAGQWVQTSTDASPCGTLMNNNGVLMCTFPSGSYQQTCQNFYWSGNPPTLPLTLNATCKNNAGQWVPTNINVSTCLLPIANHNGQLGCP